MAIPATLVRRFKTINDLSYVNQRRSEILKAFPKACFNCMSVADTLAKRFGFKKHKTDLRTEVVAGITTFLTMSYIVILNPAILGEAIQIEGYSASQITQMLAIVTLLSAGIACIVMALYANRPFGLAPGLGINAFFAYTVVLAMGIPWEVALAAVVVEGVIFIIITAAGWRDAIIAAIPKPVKFSVGAGIGLFLAIIGLKEMNVITADAVTFVELNPALAADPIALLSLLGLLVTFVLYARGVKGSIVIGILATTVLAYALNAAGIGGAGLVPELGPTTYNITPLVGAFVGGLSPAVASTGAMFSFALIIFTFFFVDFFDTAGTLIGTSQLGGFLDKKGNLPDIEKPLMADAVGTTVGGILGTSTVTTYIESATGIEEGGKTGMVALVVGVLFLVSIVAVPIAAAVPLYASHVALVLVAILMLRGVTDIDWKDVTNSVPAGLTILMMPLTFSIAYGIAAGLISYPIVKAAKEGSLNAATPAQWGLAVAFVIYLYVTTGGL